LSAFLIRGEWSPPIRSFVDENVAVRSAPAIPVSADTFAEIVNGMCSWLLMFATPLDSAVATEVTSAAPGAAHVLDLANLRFCGSHFGHVF
jgi:hypothetical protein